MECFVSSVQTVVLLLASDICSRADACTSADPRGFSSLNIPALLSFRTNVLSGVPRRPDSGSCC